MYNKFVAIKQMSIAYINPSKKRLVLLDQQHLDINLQHAFVQQKTLYKDMLYTSSPQNNLMLRKELDVYNFVLQVLQNSLRSSIQDCPTDARKEKKNIYEILVNTFIKKLMRSININCSLNATIC